MSGWCEGQWPTPDDSWYGVRYTNVAVADWMKFSRTATSANFTRVYQLARGIDFDHFDLWVCSLLKGDEGPTLAEGITQWLNTERNLCGWGPGRTSWVRKAEGILSAPTYCPKGMATFKMQLRGMLAIGAVVTDDCMFDPADVRDIKLDFNLTCVGPPSP